MNQSNAMEEETKSETELIEEVIALKSEVKQLTLENENYRQKVHELKHELCASQAMNQDMKENFDDSINRHTKNMEIKVQEITKKLSEDKSNYELQLQELESELSNKQSKLSTYEEIIEDLKKKPPPLPEITNIYSIREEELQSRNDKIQELITLLNVETRKVSQSQEAYTMLEHQSIETKELLAAAKEHLAEKDELIENLREELALSYSELNSLKTVPASDSVKGNSLFAEVEDRRKKLQNKMSAMHGNYKEMKKSFTAKEEEIRMLWKEKAKMTRQWEEDISQAESLNMQLIEAYKTRISELEDSVSYERRKKQPNLTTSVDNTSAKYFESLLESKIKEVEELQAKIESNSIRNLLIEERKCELGKQVRYWKYKALCTETQFQAMKKHLVSTLTEETKGILEFLQDKELEDDNKMQKFDDSLHDDDKKLSIVNETRITLDDLVRQPTLPEVSDGILRNLGNLQISPKSNEVDKKTQESLDMTMPVESQISVRHKKDASQKEEKSEHKNIFQSLNTAERLRSILKKSHTSKSCSTIKVETENVVYNSLTNLADQSLDLTTAEISPRQSEIVQTSEPSPKKKESLDKRTPRNPFGRLKSVFMKSRSADAEVTKKLETSIEKSEDVATSAPSNDSSLDFTLPVVTQISPQRTEHRIQTPVHFMPPLTPPQETVPANITVRRDGYNETEKDEEENEVSIITSLGATCGGSTTIRRLNIDTQLDFTLPVDTEILQRIAEKYPLHPENYRPEARKLEPVSVIESVGESCGGSTTIHDSNYLDFTMPESQPFSKIQENKENLKSKLVRSHSEKMKKSLAFTADTKEESTSGYCSLQRVKPTERPKKYPVMLIRNDPNL